VNSDLEQLVAKAWASGVGHEECPLVGIECLDSHLQGHAFKYSEQGPHLRGVYPYRLTFRDQFGKVGSVDAMLKAKPDQASMFRIYGGLLKACGITPVTPVAELLRYTDYAKPNLKEAVLFRDYEPRLAPYLPQSLGVLIDGEYTLRLEKKLAPGSLILSPDDDTTKRWQSTFPELVLNGLAEMHARFLDNYSDLIATGYFFVYDRQVMTEGLELWKGFHDFLFTRNGGVLDSVHAARHRTIIDTLPDWYALADQQPKTLLYGDVNPQNLAFARTESGFQLSVFDWERAVISLPQRDMIEQLIYTLPIEFEAQNALNQMESYRAKLGHRTGRTTERGSFLRGCAWMLCDLIINRLPLMMIVKHLTGKRPHSTEAYGNAQRLLGQLMAMDIGVHF